MVGHAEQVRCISTHPIAVHKHDTEHAQLAPMYITAQSNEEVEIVDIYTTVATLAEMLTCT